MEFNIYWDKMLMDFYKHGSRISYGKAGQVLFENEILSPGARLVSWTSTSWYQGGRTLLQLPLLKRGQTYSLVFEGQVFPEGSVLIKIDTFTRAEEKKQSIFLKCPGGSFTYPLEAYSYQISLIGTGVSRLLFERMILSEGLSTSTEE